MNDTLRAMSACHCEETLSDEEADLITEGLEGPDSAHSHLYI